ncbi:MAG: tetratricopeptide repeat protein [Reyranella sp.]|uniref:tetratricopeptide repeat protein n=1 Tax=Reyranella sp. TaxID=1929291 RepID=UPI001AD2562E|nr:tetratricopeptide repeat protein [Reyranella sp.]MBN9086864.1 tetratricopeptide repeat protein [Reyranella sp.]
MRALSILAALAIAASAGGALAMGNDSQPSSAASGDPDYGRAKAMIEARKYGEAIPVLQQVVAKNPKNADAYNLLGFATRKSGNPQGSLQYYTTALQIDPKHLGANEYIGEAYLMLDQPQQAEQHLARLDQLCVFGCAEYRELKAAIANYKAGKKPTN